MKKIESPRQICVVLSEPIPAKSVSLNYLNLARSDLRESSGIKHGGLSSDILEFDGPGFGSSETQLVRITQG